MWYKIVLNELTLKVLWWGIVTLIVLWEARWLSHSQAASSWTWIPTQTSLISNPESLKCRHLTLYVSTSLDHRKDRVWLFLGGEWKHIKVRFPHIWKWARDKAWLGEAGRRSAFAKLDHCRLAHGRAWPPNRNPCASLTMFYWGVYQTKNQLRPWTQTAWGPLCEGRKTLKVKGFPLVFCPQHLTWWAWSTGRSAVGATYHLIVWDHHRQDSLKYSKC